MARSRLLPSPYLILGCLLAPLGPLAAAQTQSMPVPTPVPSDSIPAMAAPDAPKQKSRKAPKPAPATQTSPADAGTAPATVQAAPLPAPLPASAPADAAPATPESMTPQSTVAPSTPTPAPSTPSASPAPYQDPLTAPIVVGRPADPEAAQPPSAAPVTMGPPSNVVALPSNGLPSLPAYDFEAPYREHPDHYGSTYIPVDSPIYPMALRLYSLGYLDSAFINMRPWTRVSLLHALQATATDVNGDGNEQAQMLLARMLEMLSSEAPGKGLDRGRVYGLESAYSRFMGISGTTLRDSFHLGQSLVNDYGRPYGEGFNNVTGFSSVNEYGRFSFYVRGEFQRGAAQRAYPLALASTLSCNDYTCPFAPPNNPADTIPYGSTVNAQTNFRVQEANLSVHLLNHEFSFGKSDAWMGPGYGGAMAWSNNAENIYSFRINRVEPLHIPYVSRVLGTMRYDFFVGSLKGHTDPNDPWVHSEMFAFAPSGNFQFGFQRTVIWGGKGHEAINVRTFLKSFFDINDTTVQEKTSGNDPGARYSVFNMSYRLPFVRRSLTLYVDSIVHDDVTPPSAPRRAAYRPGLYLSHIPHAEKMDFRVEAASTDTSTLRSLGGQFNYYEIIQHQGYTNKGFIMGDWIGREAKGGQAWLTYHLSADEFVQLSYLNKKTPKDFITYGTTQNQFKAELYKRLPHDFTMDAWFQFERFKAPIWLSGAQNNSTVAVQFTWWPKLKTQTEPAK